jgi:hypothetical protein
LIWIGPGAPVCPALAAPPSGLTPPTPPNPGTPVLQLFVLNVNVVDEL